MSAEGLTNTGLKRHTNQDAFLIRKDYNLYVVADGMGGHQAGKLASTIAVKTIEEVFVKEFNRGTSITEILKKAVEKANSSIYNYSKTISTEYIMGTTLTTAVISNDIAYIAHIGDSRAYKIKKDSITAVTFDHSYVGELVRNGSLSKEEAQIHPQKNILTKALGTDPQVDFDLLEVTLQTGDYLLLCTDGLFNAVSEDSIHNIVTTSTDLKMATHRLVDEALKSGGNDNITVVLVNYD